MKIAELINALNKAVLNSAANLKKEIKKEKQTTAELESQLLETQAMMVEAEYEKMMEVIGDV